MRVFRHRDPLAHEPPNPLPLEFVPHSAEHYLPPAEMSALRAAPAPGTAAPGSPFRPAATPPEPPLAGVSRMALEKVSSILLNSHSRLASPSASLSRISRSNASSISTSTSGSRHRTRSPVPRKTHVGERRLARTSFTGLVKHHSQVDKLVPYRVRHIPQQEELALSPFRSICRPEEVSSFEFQVSKSQVKHRLHRLET